MTKTKTKIITALIVPLLFLITSINCARAATYNENNIQLTKGLERYVVKPLQDLAVFTGHNLRDGAVYLSDRSSRDYLSGVTYIGNHIGLVGGWFKECGNKFSLITKTTPYVLLAGEWTGKQASLAVKYIGQAGSLFNRVGELLSIVPNNLPKVKAVGTSMNRIKTIAENKYQNLATTGQEFAELTKNNLTKKSNYHQYLYTQTLLSQAARSLDKNFTTIFKEPDSNNSNNIYLQISSNK